jgi:hypothetical protein
MRTLAYLPAILLVAPLTRATAQEQPPPLEPGAHIRLEYCYPVPGALKCEEDEGKLVALTADSVVLQASAVSRASVTKLEVRGPPTTTRVVGGAVIGSVAGALVLGMAAAAKPDSVIEGIFLVYCCKTKKNPDVVVGVVVGALGGALMGAVVGHSLRGWEEVPLDRLRVSVVPQRDGRFRLGLSVSF